MFRVLPALGAESAANITRDNAQILLRHGEYFLGQQLTNPVRILNVGMQRESVFAFVVRADGASRLHVLGKHA